jgi:ribosome recycling factor
MEEIQLYLDDCKERMEKAIKHTIFEFGKIRAGKASAGMLDGLKVEYYGSMTPINQVAAINTPDARSIIIKPFERNMIAPIERAIKNSDLGFNPQSDGETVRINIPPLTEERRKSLMKQVKNEAEQGKVAVRNIRKETNESLKKLQKDGASEDDIKKAEEKVQQFTNQFVEEIDKLTAIKEKEVMTV